MEVLDDLLADLIVGAAREKSHFAERLDQAVRVAPQDAFEKLRDAVAHLRRQFRDRPKIQQDQRAVASHEQIPGVRIGVVDAVDEDHLAIRADEPAREILLVDAERVDAREVADFLPLDERRRDHLVRRELANGHREDHAIVPREILLDALDVVGLAREVELLVKQRLDLVVVRVEPLHGHEPLHDRHDAADGDEIELHHLVDVFVLDLHRDAAAVLRLRLVDLSERRARDARAIEALEERVDFSAELVLDALRDLFERARRDLVLKPLELAAELFGKKVRHDRQELSDLDEQTLKLEDRRVDERRVAFVHRRDALAFPVLSEDATPPREPQVAADDLERRHVRAHEAPRVRRARSIRHHRFRGGRTGRNRPNANERGVLVVLFRR